MTSQDIFAFRLRLRRRRKGLRLEDISAVTRVKCERLDALERNDLSGWPQGLYARSWVRAYASLVGLDPSDTVDEFCRLFPNGDRRAGQVLREIAGIVAQPSQYEGEFREADRRRGARRAVARGPVGQFLRLLHVRDAFAALSGGVGHAGAATGRAEI